MKLFKLFNAKKEKVINKGKQRQNLAQNLGHKVFFIHINIMNN